MIVCFFLAFPPSVQLSYRSSSSSSSKKWGQIHQWMVGEWECCRPLTHSVVWDWAPVSFDPEYATLELLTIINLPAGIALVCLLWVLLSLSLSMVEVMQLSLDVKWLVYIPLRVALYLQLIPLHVNELSLQDILLFENCSCKWAINTVVSVMFWNQKMHAWNEIQIAATCFNTLLWEEH